MDDEVYEEDDVAITVSNPGDKPVDVDIRIGLTHRKYTVAPNQKITQSGNFVRYGVGCMLPILLIVLIVGALIGG